MTRFYEEMYDTRAYRAAIRLSRANHKSDTENQTTRIAAWDWERRSLRSEYFKKKAQGKTKRPATERLIEDA